MSEVSFLKLWERGAMEGCYKLFSWINHTVLMLLLQIMWKITQISDYFKEKSIEDSKPTDKFVFAPLTKESKTRRHIRSMSDVQCSTPYKLHFRARRGSTQTLMYDSDTRARRIRSYNKHLESSDSSDYTETKKMNRYLEQNILKHSDSMRIL